MHHPQGNHPAPMPTLPRLASGLSLVELMVTLAVLVVVLVLGVPQLQGLLAGNQMLTSSDTLVRALNFARSEAIKRGMRVTLCPSSDGQQCASGTGSGWEQGWITFLDRNFEDTDTSARVNTGDQVLAVQAALSRSITARAPANSPSGQYISFGADGRSLGFNLKSNLEAAETTLRVCSPSSALSDDRRAREIVVLKTGRVPGQKSARSVSATCPPPP